VLFERSTIGFINSITITWIAYRERVTRSVRLENDIKPTVANAVSSLVLERKYFKYDGFVSLALRKFFPRGETLALGEEEWFWDDQPMRDGESLTQPGGWVVLHAADRRIEVHLDQSGLLGGSQEIPASHWVRFRGKDVFGGKDVFRTTDDFANEPPAEAKLLVHTPPVTLSYRPIALDYPHIRPNPLDDPVRDRPVFDPTELVASLTEVFATRVNAGVAGSLARSVGSALTTGSGQLDGTTASALLSLLASGSFGRS
jgi:hypothetical protein